MYRLVHLGTRPISLPLALALASALPLSVQAQQGVIRFSGAITEPACSANASTIGSGRSAALQLTLNCHAPQSVRVAFEHIASTVHARPVVLSRGGRALTAGETIALPLKARQSNHLDLGLHAPGAARTDGASEPPQHDAGLLVSLTYQ